MKRNRILLLVTLFLTPAISVLAGWNSLITNFDKRVLGSGGHTWQVLALKNNDWTFMANKSGLLAFDGSQWQLHPMNNHSELRSLCLSQQQDRIYVGGINEYGYFEADKNGKLRYSCMSDTLPKEYRYIENIWGIFEADHVLYLQADHCVLKHAAGQYTHIHFEGKIHCSAMIHNVLYLGTSNGVCHLRGNRIMPLAGTEQLNGKLVRGFKPFQNGILIFTAHDGLFFWNGHTLAPFPTVADDFIRSNELFGADVRGDKIALGTVRGGIAILDHARHDVMYYNENNGLQNNTVLSVSFDKKGNVWCGLDSGIDYIQAESPFTNLYHAPHSYGSGYVACVDGDKLYLGTNRGLFRTNWPVAFDDGLPVIHSVDGSGGQVWNLCRIDGSLYCLHDRGIYRVGPDGQLHLVLDLPGVLACQPVAGSPNLLFVTNYVGLFLVRKSEGAWQTVCHVDKAFYGSRYMEQRSGRQVRLWNVEEQRLVSYQLSKDYTRVERETVRHAEWTDSSASGLSLFFGNDGIMGKVLLVDGNQAGIVPYDDGFALINLQRLHTKNQHPDNVRIRRITLPELSDSIVWQSSFTGQHDEPSIRFSDGSLCIDFSVSPLSMASGIRYQYRLNNGAWSVPSQQTIKVFNGLREGEYHFEVRALMSDGTQSRDSITFRILPPWYRSWWLYLLYIILLATLLYCGYKWILRRLRDDREKAVAEKQEQVDRLTVEVDMLEQEKIELDLKHKTHEVANLAANVARKNEILQEIKRDIALVSTRLTANNPRESRMSLAAIRDKIDTCIGADEVLQRFDEQFDLVNGGLMQKLEESHPDLSKNERLMCAYLTMNLSTKEIAPLLNITVRGMETMRYRVRKKLGLDNSINLTDYLNTIIKK